jgi:hypothetical protein
MKGRLDPSSQALGSSNNPPFRALGETAGFPPFTKGDAMLRLVLLIVLILALLGSVPMWGYNAGWGYYPSGGLGLVLIIVLILILMGRI